MLRLFKSLGAILFYNFTPFKPRPNKVQGWQSQSVKYILLILPKPIPGRKSTLGSLRGDKTGKMSKK